MNKIKGLWVNHPFQYHHHWSPLIHHQPSLPPAAPVAAAAAATSLSSSIVSFFFFWSLSPCFSISLSQSVSVWVALHLSALTRLGITGSHHRKWWCCHFSPATTAAVSCWSLVSFPMPSHTRRNRNNPLSPSISVAQSRLSLYRFHHIARCFPFVPVN